MTEYDITTDVHFHLAEKAYEYWWCFLCRNDIAFGWATLHIWLSWLSCFLSSVSGCCPVCFSQEKQQKIYYEFVTVKTKKFKKSGHDDVHIRISSILTKWLSGEYLHPQNPVLRPFLAIRCFSAKLQGRIAEVLIFNHVTLYDTYCISYNIIQINETTSATANWAIRCNNVTSNWYSPLLII